MISKMRSPGLIERLQSSRIVMILTSLFLCFTLMINLSGMFPGNKASAAPAVLIPVAGIALIGVLTALGIAAINAGSSSEPSYSLTNNYPYVSPMFEKSGSTAEDWVMVLPDDVYYTDGNTFYVGNSLENPLESISQLIVKAEYLPDNYFFPTNFTQIAPRGIRYKEGDTAGGATWINLDSMLSAGLSNWVIPYLVTSSGTVALGDKAFKLALTTGDYPIIKYRDFPPTEYTTRVSGDFALRADRPTYISPTTSNGSVYITNKYIIEDGYMTSWSNSSTGTWKDLSYGNIRYLDVNGVVISASSLPYSGAGIKSTGYLVGSEAPKFDLEVDKDKLKDVYISPYGEPQPPANPDPDDKETEIELIPPELWEVFKTITDFLGNSSSKPTNGNTTLGDFINNNYNYNNVDVDVNVPDRFTIHFDNALDINLNLSGGFNIDVNINYNTSLPEITAGDGENFFSANVIDVFAGLTTNNPVLSSLIALFGAMDPALVSIFSVTVSLMLLLALWRLIRR